MKIKRKEERESIIKEMRLWNDNYNGRVYVKKRFLEVRADPFHPFDDVKDLYVLRIEVYPETEEDKYFALKLRKKEKVFKEETCYFDEKGYLKIVSAEDSYDIILRSFHKTHIKRDLDQEENSKEDFNEKENSYFDSGLEYVEEDRFSH